MYEATGGPGSSQFFHQSLDPVKLDKQAVELIDQGEQLNAQIIRLQSSRDEWDQLTAELLQINLKNLSSSNVSPLIDQIEYLLLHGDLNSQQIEMLNNDVTKLQATFVIHQSQ